MAFTTHRAAPGRDRIVITSYSIHYTKLYEPLRRRLAIEARDLLAKREPVPHDPRRARKHRWILDRDLEIEPRLVVAQREALDDHGILGQRRADVVEIRLV